MDSAVYENCVITPFYDSMIAKVIVWAPTRKEAVTRMLEALAAFRIEGVKTTIGLHEKLLSSKAFQQGEIDTGYLEEHLEEILRA